MLFAIADVHSSLYFILSPAASPSSSVPSTASQSTTSALPQGLWECSLLLWLRLTALPLSFTGPVEFRHLALIRWRDDKGHSQRLYLMEKVSYKWRTLGQLLGLPYSKLESLAEEYRDKPEHCCRSVLGQWLENPPPDYPATWAGLIELLEDSQLGEVVSQLKAALSKAKL